MANLLLIFIFYTAPQACSFEINSTTLNSVSKTTDINFAHGFSSVSTISFDSAALSKLFVGFPDLYKANKEPLSCDHYDSPPPESPCFLTRGEGGTDYNGLYGEAPPERGIFFRL